MQRDLFESKAAMLTQPVETLANARGVVLGEIDQHLALLRHGEGVEARGGGSDRECEVESQPGLALSCRVPDCAASSAAPPWN